MPDPIQRLREHFQEHGAVLAATEALLPKVEQVAQVLVGCFKNNHRLYTMGNGGSAADALHFAEELLGRYRRDRRPLAAQSFVGDPTGLTCISNDFGWPNVFARQAEGLVHEGDVVLGISTSGNSENILNAMQIARQKKAITIGMTGERGGKLASLVDHLLNVPSMATARIQEMHIFIIHLLCERIDDWVLGT